MKKGEEVLLSTVIPVYNGASYIGEAIDSVLSQDTMRSELIVVDDGSTDDTPFIAAQYGSRLRCIRKVHSGISETMNRGVQEAKGEYLAFLDADDYWLPGKLKVQLEVLRQKPSPDMVFTSLEQFFTPEKEEELKGRYKIPLAPEQGIHSGTLLIRRSLFLKVGLFDESLKTGQFNDWFMRAKHLGLTHRVLQEVFYRRRIHGGNHGIVSREHSADYLRVLRDHLKRNRESRSQSGKNI
jgi:glycosyltransferase involved in cell wall biosynthesis